MGRRQNQLVVFGLLTSFRVKIPAGCFAFLLLLSSGLWLSGQDAPVDPVGSVAPVSTVSQTPVSVPAVADPAKPAGTADATLTSHTRRLMDYGLPGLDAKVNLTTLEPWDVVQLIDFLAHRGGLKNIVISKGVAGLTTKLKFDNVTVGDALEVVMSVNQLAYEIKGGIITVMTDEEYKLLYGGSFYDNKKIRVVELKYADPVRLAQILASVKSSIGTIVADPVAGNVILIDTTDKITEMEGIIRKADLATVARVLPTDTRSFVLQYATVDDIAKEVSALLSKEAGAVRTNQRTKTLIVTDLAHNMEKIEQLIALFDRPSRQVFIEAKIVETTLGDDFSMGINWQHLFDGLDPRFNVKTVLSPLGARDLANPSAQLTYNMIAGGADLTAILEALKTYGDTKILANPHIAVVDGNEAKIEVIEDQPYKETTIESGTTNVTGVTYLFKKVGVQLSVTPRINDENFINVAIKPEISSIADWYDGAPQEGTPVIRKAYAETTVMVKDGVTVIIGGMIKNQKAVRTTQVPVLGSIPLLGWFFRYHTTSAVNSETVVFLTPQIVTGAVPHQRMEDMRKQPKPMRETGENGKEIKPVR